MSVLKNKAYKSYDKLSRYAGVPYYYHTRDDKFVSGITSYLDNTTIYTSYTVRRGDTLDNLALKYYNNPTYFWIIASFNHIRNPYKPLEVGSVIKIPSLSNIKFDTQKRS